MRGEKSLCLPERAPVTGSPPHARGKVDAEILADHGDGITPACAGKSSIETVTINGTRDHPRMRGEKAKKTIEKSDFLFFVRLLFNQLSINSVC